MGWLRRCQWPGGWQERLVRARELYVAGDTGRGRYPEETWVAQVALTSPHPLPEQLPCR